MVFWTIVFIFMDLLYFVKGDILKKQSATLTLYGKESKLIKGDISTESEERREEIKDELFKILFQLFIVWLPYAVAMIIYYIVALKVDIYKYPSMVMLFLSILSILRLIAGKKKNDTKTIEDIEVLKQEINHKKYYTTKGIITALIRLGYFSYMFYILVLI